MFMYYGYSYSETQDPVMDSEMIGSDARVMYYNLGKKRSFVAFYLGAAETMNFKSGNKGLQRLMYFHSHLHQLS